jgi:hypothetical protein
VVRILESDHLEDQELDVNITIRWLRTRVIHLFSYKKKVLSGFRIISNTGETVEVAMGFKFCKAHYGFLSVNYLNRGLIVS